MAILQTLKQKMSHKEEKTEKSSASAAVGSSPAVSGVVQDPKGILRKARVTEKATTLAKNRIYTFEIAPTANKHLVKEAVERVHNVTVTAVHMVHTPRKRRARGRMEGWKRGNKKALVKIKEGQTIEISN